MGRQLFEEALTGDLGTGRTRILVTHHFGLTMPKTEYAVILGEGTVQHAGPVEELQREGSLHRAMEDIIEGQDGDTKADEQDPNEHVSGTLHKISSNVTEGS